MIVIKLKGGLGNQLFQYAFGRLLELRNKANVEFEFSSSKVDTQREYKLGHFNTVINFTSSKESRACKIYYSVINMFKTKILRQYNIGYIQSLLNKKGGYLEGYFQSYKYLEPIQKELLQELTLKEPIEQKFKDIIDRMNQTNSVSVHIRRGDYVSDPKTKSQHCTFGLEYYEEAFKKIKSLISNPTLFVFSDDIEWVKENLKSDLPMTYVSDPNMPDYENFFIATYCKHNIIANSSFSYWIAWLNQNPSKIVIAPGKWNNRYNNQYKDLLPPEWIKIKI
jgi:hypothetical protein